MAAQLPFFSTCPLIQADMTAKYQKRVTNRLSKGKDISLVEIVKIKEALLTEANKAMQDRNGRRAKAITQQTRQAELAVKRLAEAPFKAEKLKARAERRAANRAARAAISLAKKYQKQFKHQQTQVVL